MPKRYSRDLRERVLRFYRRRSPPWLISKCRYLFVVNLLTAFRASGSLAPKPSGGRRHAKLVSHQAFLWAQVAEKPEMKNLRRLWLIDWRTLACSSAN